MPFSTFIDPVSFLGLFSFTIYILSDLKEYMLSRQIELNSPTATNYH